MSQSLPRQILQRARDILADPNRWTRDALARDKSGDQYWPREGEAVRFCMLSAIERAGTDCGIKGNADPLVIAAQRHLAATINPRWLSLWRKNHPTSIGEPWQDEQEDLGAHSVVAGFYDRRTHEQVLAKFDKALEKVT